MRSAAFWDITPSNHPAFITHDGQVILYSQLKQDIDAFRERLQSARGLISILCDGSYRQYVAYLSALQQKCPVILVAAESNSLSSFSVRYTYDAANDQLNIDDSVTEVPLHPELALLLSTSGSTGAAKSVKLSYGNLEANAQAIAEYLELDNSEKAPMALPFYYSYGLSIINSHLQVGATIVLTQGSVIDPAFWQTFKRVGCTSLAGVPHSFELMEQQHISTEDLASLRYMTQAGGKLAPAKVKLWSQRATQEGWRFFVMYGQTEASPRIAYLPPEMAFDNPESIGLAIPGGQLDLIDDHGKIITGTEPGELVYTGPNVMMGYALEDQDLAAEAGDPILHTGDIATRQANGLYDIVGRKSRFVKVFGYRISLDSVEKKLSDQGFEVACSASSSANNSAKGEKLYILLSEDSLKQHSLAEVEQQVATWLNIPNTAFCVSSIATIPRKTNGKIDNQAISQRVEQLEKDAASPTDKTASKTCLDLAKKWLGLERSASVLEVFQHHFSHQKVEPTDSFKSLGGDSLVYMSVAMELENLLGHLPENWGDMPIEVLQKKSGPSGLLASIDSISLFRCLSISIIVVAHLTSFSYSPGGAYILFFIAGWTLAGFTLPKVLEQQSARPMVVLAIRIGLLTAAVQWANKLLTGWGHWSGLLLVSNWVSPGAAGAWFVEVYLQLLLIFAALLTLAPVRRWLAKDLFKTLFIATTLFTLIAAISDLVVDTHHLFRRLPHILAWMLLAGATLHYADTVSKRLLLSATFIFGCFQFHEYQLPLDYLLLVGLTSLWFPRIPMPKLLLKPIRLIAGASLMIYLTHISLGLIVHKVLPEAEVLAVLIALSAGVVIWQFYSPLDQRLRDIFSRP